MPIAKKLIVSLSMPTRIERRTKWFDAAFEPVQAASTIGGVRVLLRVIISGFADSEHFAGDFDLILRYRGLERDFRTKSKLAIDVSVIDY